MSPSRGAPYFARALARNFLALETDEGNPSAHADVRNLPEAWAPRSQQIGLTALSTLGEVARLLAVPENHGL